MNSRIGKFQSLLENRGTAMSKIKNHDNNFIKDFFIHYMQPAFYNTELTLEETIQEWRIFGQLYEESRLYKPEIKKTNFSLLEHKLDDYYSQNQEHAEHYRYRKYKLKSLMTSSSDYEYDDIRFVYNQPFKMPDIEIFKKAEAIGRYFSLASLSSTYTDFQTDAPDIDPDQQMNNLLSKFYNLLSTMSEQYAQNNDIGFNFLHCQFIGTSHSMVDSVDNSAAHYHHSTRSITLYNIDQKNDLLETFLHEYTHFIDKQHYSISQQINLQNESNSSISEHSGKIEDIFNLRFSPYPGRFRNNELYQIKDKDYYCVHEEFIQDYNNIIYFNLTGNQYNALKSYNEMQAVDYQILFEPVSNLIANQLIVNTDTRQFIEKNKDYLSDFISSIRYILEADKVEACLNLEDDTFSEIISLDQHMKHTFNEENLSSETDKVKVLQNIFISIVEQDRKISDEFELQDVDSQAPCVKRIYDYYSTIGLYIPANTHLSNMLFFNQFIDMPQAGLNYFSLPGEMLAYALTYNLEEKPDYIKKENAKFYQKYIDFLAKNIPHEIKSFDSRIMENFDILKNQKIIHESTQFINEKKQVISQKR